MTSISTIIPVKNGAAFIADALDSIARQALSPDEILIVNDGSTDNTAGIVSRYARSNPAIRLLQGPGKGPGPARNVALKQARGDIITFLDADDLWPADKLQIQVARMMQEPRVDVVSGYVRYFDMLCKDTLAPADESRTNDIFHVHLGAAIFRRAVFEKLGEFHEGMTYSEDVDLVLRIRESDFTMTILNHITLYYRRHEHAMTAKITRDEARSFNLAIMRSMMRRKAAGIRDPLPPFSTLIEDVK